MAIEQSLIQQQFHVGDNKACVVNNERLVDEIRNAPTPCTTMDWVEPFEDFGFDGISPSSILGIDAGTDSYNLPQTFTFSQTYTSTIPSAGFPDDAQSYPDLTADLYSNQIYQNQMSVESHIPNDIVKDTKGSKKKCMSRNAIAARENREKKKREMVTLNSRVNDMEIELCRYRKLYNESQETVNKLQERNNYLESIIQNIPQIINLVDHMTSIPSMKLNNVNLHSETTMEDGHSTKKAKLRNKTNDCNNNLNPGVCFHVKSGYEMSLQFCHACSGKNSKKPFEKKLSET